jgi:LuxR family transcriptional regulator, maltose regulon positive regulatory protein
LSSGYNYCEGEDGLIAPVERFNIPLIKTKLSAPQLRAGMVSRSQLLGHMEASANYPFTLVCAPAGYGKTTLLIHWISNLKKNSKTDHPIVCWLSLDDGDNETDRFLSYWIAAFEKENIGISHDIHTLLQAATLASAQAILTVLINDLEILGNPIYFVLDDYQFISNKTIHEGVTFFLEHLPTNVHLIISTRSDPPIPIARLRSRGQMTEIRADELRFSYEEVECLFNQVMGLNLTANDMTSLEERTEGWIAGLQMAALALKSNPQIIQDDKSLFIKNFSGSNRYILDYLVEEVLNHQPQDIQDFLLQTSILENLNGPLCDAVTDNRVWNLEGVDFNSQAILVYLERSNLFLVSLDTDRLWYRYHHLFASLLRSRNYQLIDIDTVQELYHRASQWYESQGLLGEAITQALAAPDLSYAADLLERNILTFFYLSEITQVHRWLEVLPKALILQHALLCAVYAASIALLPPYPPQSLLEAEKWMQAAEAALSNDFQGRDLARAFIFKIRSYWGRFRGSPPEIVLQLIAKALSLLPMDETAAMDRNQLFIRSAIHTNLGLTYWASGDDEAARKALIQARQMSSACGDLYNESSAIIYLAKISCLHGRLGEAAALCREALTFFVGRQTSLGRRVPYSSEIGIQLAEILIEQNELAGAEKLLNENLELAKWTMDQGTLVRVNLAFAHLAAIHGHQTAAFEYLNEAEKISEEGAGLAGALRVDLWLALSGNSGEYWELARQWGQKFSLVEFGQGSPQREWTISLSLARVILMEEDRLKVRTMRPRLVGLLEWLEQQKWVIQGHGWTHWEIQLCVIECLTRQMMSNKAGALAVLRHALELAAPGGYIRIFVDEGEPIHNLLVELDNEAGQLKPYLRSILSAFSDTSGQPVSSLISSHGLGEQLTARESEILQAMAEGLTNRQIADKLILAEGTVKFYVHEVLEKLGVHSRTQAVIEAKKIKTI